jgi:hypothetical protein
MARTNPNTTAKLFIPCLLAANTLFDSIGPLP